MPSVAAPDLVAPAYQWMPEYHETLGPEVSDFCAEVAGFTPDPEQRLALDWMFATRRDGRSAVRDFGVCAPRQNMKTGLLKMAALGWLYVLETRLVVWSAHEFRTSQEAFRDMCLLIEDNPDLDREVLRTARGKTGISRGNGDEAIELRGDRRLIFKARTSSGGRGLTGDRIVLDEAMYLSPDMMAALLPTLRAVPDPQVVYAGSAGLLQSSEWRRIRDDGRGGADPTLGWLEWGDRNPWSCADPECMHIFGVAEGCALDDEDRWWATNSALGRRITVESLRADRKRLAPLKFATETLGWWEDPPAADGAADNGLPGYDLATTDRAPVAPLTLGLEVSTDSRTAAIAVHGADVVEVVEYRKGAGLGWVPARVTELRERYNAALAVRAGSPAMQLLPDLPEAVVVKSTEQAAACMSFATSMNAADLLHRAQPVLDIAAANAVRTRTGDVWRWSLSRSAEDRGTDISPLWAAVLARHIAGTSSYDPDDNFFP